MEKIQNISSNATYIVRNPVLRPEQPIESCIFEGDDLETTSHFGLFINDELIGVVSVFKNNSSIFNVENQFQIRGMALLQQHQKKGYGTLLVKHCERFIISQKSNLIWFNARKNAVPFYEKLGYKVTSSEFVEVTIPHYIMEKKL